MVPNRHPERKPGSRVLGKAWIRASAGMTERGFDPEQTTLVAPPELNCATELMKSNTKLPIRKCYYCGSGLLGGLFQHLVKIHVRFGERIGLLFSWSAPEDTHEPLMGSHEARGSEFLIEVIEDGSASHRDSPAPIDYSYYDQDGNKNNIRPVAHLCSSPLTLNRAATPRPQFINDV